MVFIDLLYKEKLFLFVSFGNSDLQINNFSASCGIVSCRIKEGMLQGFTNDEVWNLLAKG